jgi:hypothetical protein
VLDNQSISHYLAKLARICEHHYILHTYPRWCVISDLYSGFHISCYPFVFTGTCTCVSIAIHFLT